MESYISLYDRSKGNSGLEGQHSFMLHPVTISVNFCGTIKQQPVGSNQIEKVSGIKRVSFSESETMNIKESEQRSGRKNRFSGAKTQQGANMDLMVKHNQSSSSKLTTYSQLIQ